MGKILDVCCFLGVYFLGLTFNNAGFEGFGVALRLAV